MNLYWRGRSLLRTLADTMVFVVLLVLVLAATRQAGVFAPESGRFTAIDGDSLRKGTAEYRLHAIDAPELDQFQFFFFLGVRLVDLFDFFAGNLL